MRADDNLLTQCQRFEPQALRTLHARLYEPVYRYVYFKTGGAQTADDLTSDIFFRALSALRREGGWQTTPEAWMFGIARNVVADYYRQRERYPTTDLEEKVVEQVNEDSIQQAIRRENRDALAQAIAQLTEDQREVVLLRFVEGLKISEVATVLGKTPGAVKGLQHRALRALKDAIQPAPLLDAETETWA